MVGDIRLVITVERNAVKMEISQAFDKLEILKCWGSTGPSAQRMFNTALDLLRAAAKDETPVNHTLDADPTMCYAPPRHKGE